MNDSGLEHIGAPVPLALSSERSERCEEFRLEESAEDRREEEEEVLKYNASSSSSMSESEFEFEEEPEEMEDAKEEDDGREERR